MQFFRLKNEGSFINKISDGKCLQENIHFAKKNVILGKGQNIENQNFESLKADQKFERDQNVKSLFFKLIRSSKMKRLIRTLKIRTSKRTLKVKNDFRCSDFTYGVKKDQIVKNQKINYLWRITYDYQDLWGVRLGSIRLGQVRLGQVR